MTKGQQILLALGATFCLQQAAVAQSTTTTTGGDNKTIITAVPFLTITPDARAGAMGDVGAATSPDGNSAFWNPGKLNFVQKAYGVNVNFTPWLRKLANDVYLSNLSGYYKLSKQDAVAMGFTYFSLGSLQFTDVNGGAVATFNPRELSLYATYSRALSENFGVGATLRYINSDLSGNFSNSTGVQAQAVNSASVDLGAYYKTELSIAGNPSELAFGGSISNIGPKVSYSNNQRADFIPTNLRLGTSLTTEIDEFNKFTVAVDANKLMVPTPVNGTVPDNIPLFQGMFQSLYSAPGGGSEKLSEIQWGVGLEYWYDNLFAVRGGYFHEDREKGNRRYFTTGIGLHYQVFGLDLAYVIATDVNHPLNETLRFSLHFSLSDTKAQKIKEESIVE